jgi:hypothetical protein
MITATFRLDHSEVNKCCSYLHLYSSSPINAALPYLSAKQTLYTDFSASTAYLSYLVFRYLNPIEYQSTGVTVAPHLGAVYYDSGLNATFYSVDFCTRTYSWRFPPRFRALLPRKKTAQESIPSYTVSISARSRLSDQLIIHRGILLYS